MFRVNFWGQMSTWSFENWSFFSYKHQIRVAIFGSKICITKVCQIFDGLVSTVKWNIEKKFFTTYVYYCTQTWKNVLKFNRKTLSNSKFFFLLISTYSSHVIWNACALHYRWCIIFIDMSYNCVPGQLLYDLLTLSNLRLDRLFLESKILLGKKPNW